MQIKDPTVAVRRFPEGAWYKSSASSPNGECVEVNMGLLGENLIGVRDSKQLGTDPFTFSRQGWGSFVADVQQGRFQP